MDSKHVILTRFSVRAHAQTAPHSTAWLAHRLGLFEAYCVPSLSNQTCREFSWLVFCDESTEARCLQRLRAWADEIPQLSIVVTSPGDPLNLAAVRSAGRGKDLLVTSRVDSDDATSTDFVERVQAYSPAFIATQQTVMLLNFSRGFKLLDQEETLHVTWNPHSPHLTMFERLEHQDRPLTVLSGNHGFLHERHPVHIDAGPPAWAQVIHPGNVSNRVTPVDVEVPLSILDDRFVIQRSRRQGQPVPTDQPEGAEERAAFRQALEVALLPDEPERPRPPGR